MLLKQIFTEKLAHCSYILSSGSACAVVDPRRDIGVYIEEARSMGVRITHIIETHLHADFVSGHMDLAAEAGAAIHAPGSAGCTFEHVPLSSGDRIELGSLVLEVMETPGTLPSTYH